MGLQDEKSNFTVDNGSSEHDGLEIAVDEKRGTADDRADMFRLGKIQELRVCLAFLRCYFDLPRSSVLIADDFH